MTLSFTRVFGTPQFFQMSGLLGRPLVFAPNRLFENQIITLRAESYSVSIGTEFMVKGEGADLA